jgi:multiple sugar transport system permease protein
MFFNRYRKKSEGVIRFYDLSNPLTKLFTILIFLACVFMLIVSVFPAIWVFLASFKDIAEFRKSATILPEAFDMGKYVETWKELKFSRYYLNSFISVTGSVVCAVVFNGLLAYVLGVLKPKGHKIIFSLVMWSLLIPPTTSIVALYVNINRVGLNQSFLPLWLAMGANAFWVVLFKQYFESLPKEYIEAARLDGCSDLQIFTKIILPLSKPIVAVVTIFAVTAAWSDFLLPFLVLAGSDKETVMVRLFEFRTASKSTDVDVLRAIAFSIIPPTVVFAIFQKQITKGIGAGGIKG